MDANAVAQIVAEDREDWKKLVARLDAHSKGPVHDAESPEWTARDVFTHLARVIQSTNTLLAKLADVPVALADAFDEFDGSDEDVVNARIQEKYSRLSLEEARAWAQRVFEERCETIEAVAQDRWDTQLEELASGDGAEHYRAHAAFIGTD